MTADKRQAKPTSPSRDRQETTDGNSPASVSPDTSSDPPPEAI
ncbi:hypothetical protein [Haloterrigena sp. H1]|nr:hypothetical protein [Haloterrigena sp. H1]